MIVWKNPLWWAVGLLAVLTACTGTAPGEPAAENASGEYAAAATRPEPTPFAGPTRTRVDTSRYEDYRIVTLLPPDAIRSIDSPTFLTAAEADEQYEPAELVIGVSFDGEARAYSVSHLSSHEIVNDTVSGRKIAVTW